MTDAVIAPIAKVDPETLAIRTKPPRAIRFRRGVIVAITALGSVSLMAVAWVALKPHVFSAVADRQELSEPSNRPSTDALNGLPSTYGNVPTLGPALPGDLGRPILESQRRMATETGAGTDPSAQLAAQERERQLSELKAARESGLLVQGRTIAPTPAAADAASTSTPGPSSAPSVSPAIDPDRTRTRKAEKPSSSVRSIEPVISIPTH